MNILILIGQRKCRYEGEYAPEALDAIDEYGNDDDPEFMANAMERANDSKEFDSLAVIKVRIVDSEVSRALNPPQKLIEGVVIPTYDRT